MPLPLIAALALQASAPGAPGTAPALPATAPSRWPVVEGDFIVRDYRFRSGETLPEVRLHYATLGQPHRNAAGEIDNAVMVLHGTGAAGGSS